MQPKKPQKTHLYITGRSALSIWGTDWHRLRPKGDLQIAGRDIEPLWGLFSEDTIKDCTEMLKESDYEIPPGIQSIPCATPVRAYVEWVYTKFLKGKIPEIKPDDLLFEPEELERVMEYLVKLQDYLTDKKQKGIYLRWLETVTSSRSQKLRASW